MLGLGRPEDFVLTAQTDDSDIERTCLISDRPLRLLRSYALFGVRHPLFPRLYLRRLTSL